MQGDKNYGFFTLPSVKEHQYERKNQSERFLIYRIAKKFNVHNETAKSFVVSEAHRHSLLWLIGTAFLTTGKSGTFQITFLSLIPQYCHFQMQKKN